MNYNKESCCEHNKYIGSITNVGNFFISSGTIASQEELLLFSHFR
jgi:hypothetical protein